MDFGRITDPQAWKQAMANLLRRGEEVGTYIEQAPTKAGQAIIDAGQRQSALMDKAFDPTGKTLIRNPQAANQAAMNLLEGPLGFMPAGITAWHGSPHTFEKFDMSKVGTGEGAQAYGHGMYFAEAPEVAKSYSTLGTGNVAYKGHSEDVMNKLQKAGADYDVADLISTFAYEGGYKGGSSKDLSKFLKSFADTPEEVKLYKDLANKPEVVEAINSYVAPKQANLYKVDIPDEHILTMMDWDKPLGQQSDFVKKAINNLKKQVTPEMKMELGGDLNLLFGKDITPNQFLNTWEIIHPTGGTGIGEKLLNEQGVKGIRYLDNASRDAGKGTSNFVVFDPTDVKILERNNQPLSRKELIQEQLDKITK